MRKVYIEAVRAEELPPPTLLLPDPYRPSTFAEYRINVYELVQEQHPLGFTTDMRWKH